jgi:hypothetical protein
MRAIAEGKVLTSIRYQKVLRSDLPIASFIHTLDLDGQSIHGLKDIARYPLHEKTRRSRVFPHLVNREYTIAHQSRFCGGELGKHQTRTITQDNRFREVDGLEMLGLSWCRGNADLFLAEQRVDGAGLSDVGVPNEADDKFRREFSFCVGELWRYGQMEGISKEKPYLKGRGPFCQTDLRAAELKGPALWDRPCGRPRPRLLRLPSRNPRHLRYPRLIEIHHPKIPLRRLPLPLPLPPRPLRFSRLRPPEGLPQLPTHRAAPAG